MSDIHVGDIGTQLVVLVEDENGFMDISGATVKQILLFSPRGDLLIRDASFVTDGTDGLLVYTTLKDDLLVAGEWKIQADLTNSSGSWSTDVKTFDVLPNVGGRS
jgi:hypothetical protein